MNNTNGNESKISEILRDDLNLSNTIKLLELKIN
jgi:hypothetical protein